MIQAQDLEKRFGAAQALKDSTFSVRAGRSSAWA
jgi:ABC-type branched-subunit amino acid transport system ATPase component